MYGDDRGRGPALLRLADGPAGGSQNRGSDRPERGTGALEGGERGVQPPEEQRLEPGARLQHRPGELEVVLPAVADRLPAGATAGARPPAAAAGGRGRH